jgi:hypothetical protein
MKAPSTAVITNATERSGSALGGCFTHLAISLLSSPLPPGLKKTVRGEPRSSIRVVGGGKKGYISA